MLPPDTHPNTKVLFQKIALKYSSKADIKLKSQSWVFRLLAKILKPINPKFLEEYTTTIGTTIWIPDVFWNWSDEQTYCILSHEIVHLFDYKNHPLKFMLSYVFPQALALASLGALGAIWGSLWWLLCIGFLGFLSPLPAPWRARSEMRGYTMSIMCEYIIWNQVFKSEHESIINQFVGSGYYYMWPFASQIDKILTDRVNTVTNNHLSNLEDSQPYFDVSVLTRTLYPPQ